MARAVVVLPLLGLLPAYVEGQAEMMMGGMAADVAKEVAGVVADKVEDKLQKTDEVMPCIGPACCQESSCMNFPGLRCASERGPAKCVGSQLFPPMKGKCGCFVGACSSAGRCSTEGLPDTFGDQRSALEHHRAEPLVPLGNPASGSAQWFGKKDAKNGPAMGTSFFRWHRPSRLYDTHTGGVVPKEDFTFALSAYILLTLAILLTLTTFVRRVTKRRFRGEPQWTCLDFRRDGLDTEFDRESSPRERFIDDSARPECRS